MENSSTKSLAIHKKLVFTLLLLTFSVLLAEISLQALYRVAAGQWLWQWWAIPLYESDGSRIYRVRSNLDYIHKTSEYTAIYYTNAQGFRTDAGQKATAVEKPRDTYRVMYLGPSFAFGWGVDFEQSYAYLISNALRVPNKRIECINVGTPAQPMNYQLAWFEKQGYRYAPDLIVQTVYSDCNDMATDGTLPKDVPYVEGNYLYPPPPSTVGDAVQQTIRRYRRYCALLFFGWRVYAAVVPSKEKSGMGRELYDGPAGHDGYEPDVILGKYRAYQRFVQGALGKEIPIVFVYVPLAYVVRPADIVRVGHQGKHKDPLAERSTTRKVQRMLTDKGMHFVDLTDALVLADEKTRMYRLYDIHFTPAGNRVAADTATPIIQKAIDDSL
jgi:hypothetical protein